MTWFEAQQIHGYLSHLEEQLEEWALTKNKMILEQASLSRLSRRLNRDIVSDNQPSKGVLLQEICYQIQECQDCIAERLRS